MTAPADPRTLHYGEFYGLDPVPADRPIWLVHGNCQAESVRILLAGVLDAPYRTVRMPPVHELEQDDLTQFDRWLDRADVVLSQPIQDGYRGHPVGTRDIATKSHARLVRWPVIRYAGLYPYQAIVRHPSDPSAVPPVAPYHDLRTVAAARDGVDIAHAVLPPAADPAALREVAERSIAELARREQRDTDVGVSDLLLAAGVDAGQTINHPGNTILTSLVERILNALNISGEVPDPGRMLLASVLSPLEPAVIDALALDAEPRTRWHVDGQDHTVDDVHRAHLGWYADHPQFVAAALERHAATMSVLGLGE